MTLFIIYTPHIFAQDISSNLDLVNNIELNLNMIVIIITSQIRAVDFEQVFIKYAKKGIKCVYLAFSSKMSGTYQTAKLVAEEVKKKYPDFQIEIIDTKSGSTAIGLLVKKILEFKKMVFLFNK